MNEVMSMQDSPNTLKVRDSNVTGNSVQSNGGGIYGDNMNLADFTDVRFQDNIAGSGELSHIRYAAALPFCLVVS